MRKFALLVAPLLLVLAMAFAGCGKGGSTSASCAGTTVNMTSDNFAVNCSNIKAGDTISFVNPASAAAHILCIGKDQSCSGGSGPDALTNGHTLQIQPGETKTVTFPNTGTFSVTCTVHPNMNLTVTVS